MKVAGVGFRGQATQDSLADALARAGAGEVTLIATADSKAGAPVLQGFAAGRGLALRGISRSDLARQTTLTWSARVADRFGTGSVAEAAALAAAGPGARLLGPRSISEDGLATAAIAIGEDE